MAERASFFARCQVLNCQTCGDRVIHQGARGQHESSSEFGQWVHDELPRKFGFSDVDGIARAHRGRGMPDLLRIFEHKPVNQAARWREKRTQLATLALLAAVVSDAIIAGTLDEQSGVFVVLNSTRTTGVGHFTVHKLSPLGAILPGIRLEAPPRERFPDNDFTWHETTRFFAARTVSRALHDKFCGRHPAPLTMVEG